MIALPPNTPSRRPQARAKAVGSRKVLLTCWSQIHCASVREQSPGEGGGWRPRLGTGGAIIHIPGRYPTLASALLALRLLRSANNLPEAEIEIMRYPGT